MKMKKNFKLYFSETLNFVDFKDAFRFFISCFDQKLQPSKIGIKWPKRAKTGKWTYFVGL